jgi:periplasmic protein TonB
MPFGEGMTRPQLLSGEVPKYTREAMALRVEGKVIVRCVITVAGEMQDCKIIKGVPILNEIVLSTLRTNRYTPVMFQGRPQAVQYVQPFNFKLP